ncbi:MAG: molybdopterin molybdochelatase [Gemmatimonadetes bacterium]|nr:molybdopterin molybdochelatase [Gemmatimonadota bacterium]
MRTVDEHLGEVLAHTHALESLDVSLLESRGCLLAEPVTAPWALPPFDAAGTDGYAVMAADVATASAGAPIVMPVTDDVPAGYRASHPIVAGTAIRIGSGAPLPTGATAVVPFAFTDGGMPTVAVTQAVAAGHGVRRAGEDVDPGQTVLPAGALVGAREVALLAAVGRARVTVRPRPRVVVMSTGTELVEPGAPMTPGLIPDSNGYMLTAAAQDAGAMAYRAGPVRDEARALMDTLEDQLVRADLIVTTGGVTAGTYDTMKTVLARLGSVEFTRVAMSPGMAQGHGYLGPDNVPIFTLPGNPSSAFVAFEIFVRPVIRRMLGHQQVFRPLIPARLTHPVRGQPGVRTYLRGHLHGAADERLVSPIAEPGLLGLRMADSLIVLPEATGEVAAGAVVSVMPLGRS